MRRTISYPISDVFSFRQKLLRWAQRFEEVAWLDSNAHQDSYSAFDALLAVDGSTSWVTDFQNGFSDLSDYRNRIKDWIFGYLSYDLKNDVEPLVSNNHDGLYFPDLYFFQPKKIIRIKGNFAEFIYLNLVSGEIEGDYDGILRMDDYSLHGEKSPGEHQADEAGKGSENAFHIKMRIFKDEYFSQVQKLLRHIQRGDIYEANFCQEFYAEHTQIDALSTYFKLNSISKAPFAAFLKVGDKYLLSASPERYLRKQGDTIISQPIKGTAKRSRDKNIDSELRTGLFNDAKERAENVMIVDLVRNDLSKGAVKGSVKVEELCGVYTFQQVHQMISTVSAKVPNGKNPVDIIKKTFPMGSMTGAPKISAMKIIEELESFKRGLYSGAVGYFTPGGNFDFSVVIRSILYNVTEKYVSYSVGSAITANSDPAREYEECLLKAKAMREVLGGK